MMTRTVMTVNGPVPADDLGIVLIHEHLFANALREYRSDGLVNDPEMIAKELELFKAAGGGTVVELTGTNLGRSPELLKRVSMQTGVHVVMGCGYYRDPYLRDIDIDRRSTALIAEDLVSEIENGVQGTGIRPGIIGEVGADAAWVSAAEERALRAAGLAQRATGLTITLHAARWTVGRELVDILTDVGVEPDRIIVGHLDTVPDEGFHLELAERGLWVEFDGFASAVEFDVDRQIGWIVALLAAGHRDRILLSHDLFRQSHFTAYGGVGFAFLLTTVRDRLSAAGVSDEDIDRLLRVNPQRALAG